MPVAYSTENEEYHLKIRPGDVGRYVILPGDPGRCEKIALSGSSPFCFKPNIPIYTGELEGEMVSVQYRHWPFSNYCHGRADPLWCRVFCAYRNLEAWKGRIRR